MDNRVKGELEWLFEKLQSKGNSGTEEPNFSFRIPDTVILERNHNRWFYSSPDGQILLKDQNELNPDSIANAFAARLEN